VNKKELFECLSGLSKTNNLRDGIDIRKEEANIIVNEIERLNNIINELFEYLKENSKQPELFESDRYYEDILDKLQELLGSDKEW